MEHDGQRIFPNITGTLNVMTNSLNFTRLINRSSFNNNDITIADVDAGVLKAPETWVILTLCFAALFANILSIIATLHIPTSTHSKLIISLAASDILMTFSVFTEILNRVFNTHGQKPFSTSDERLTSACMYQFVDSVNIMAHLTSLLNLFAMAIDHYVAILKPLRYIHIMSSCRANLMIIVIWIFALLFGFSNFLTGFGKTNMYRYLNFCEFSWYSPFQAEYVVIATAAICLPSMLFMYLRIFVKVKSLQSNCTTLHKDGLHNKKAVLTSALIIGTFVICWLPNLFFQIGVVIQIHVDNEAFTEMFQTLLQANTYLYILLLCNSVCDPIIYAVRLKVVQRGYHVLLSRCSTFYRQKLNEETYNQSMEEFLSRKRSTLPSVKTPFLRDPQKDIDENCVNVTEETV